MRKTRRPKRRCTEHALRQCDRAHPTPNLLLHQTLKHILMPTHPLPSFGPACVKAPVQHSDDRSTDNLRVSLYLPQTPLDPPQEKSLAQIPKKSSRELFVNPIKSHHQSKRTTTWEVCQEFCRAGIPLESKLVAPMPPQKRRNRLPSKASSRA